MDEPRFGGLGERAERIAGGVGGTEQQAFRGPAPDDRSTLLGVVPPKGRGFAYGRGRTAAGAGGCMHRPTHALGHELILPNAHMHTACMQAYYIL